MKSIYYFLSAIALVTTSMAKVSLSSFENLPLEEKKQALQSDFITGYEKPSEMLAIYTLGMMDENESISNTSVLISSMFTPFLQQLQDPEYEHEFGEGFTPPVFSEEDAKAFQTALLQSANKETPRRVKVFALQALIFCHPPNEELEKFYLAKLRAESDQLVKRNLIRCLAMAGYKSDDFVRILLDTLGPNGPQGLSLLPDIASNALVTIKPKSAIPELISWIQNPDAAQANILNTLAQYGKEASGAKEPLKELLLDKNAAENLLRTAKKCYTAIASNSPPEDHAYEVLKLKPLWSTKLFSSKE